MTQFCSDLVLPEDVKPLFLSLVNHLVYLNMKWEFYKELFFKKENSKLLAQTAYHFFDSLGQAFWYDITLGICNLADKPEYKTKTGKKKETLCLEMLVKRCEANETVMDSLKEFKKKSKSFSRLRHRAIAHLDLNANLRREKLPKISEGKVEEALELAGKVIEGLSSQYGNNPQLIFKPIVSYGGASELIFWLKEGKENQERKNKILKEGRIPD